MPCGCSRGDPDAETEYSTDPTEVAKHFESDGARRIHVVDLDAALDTGNNREVVKEIIRNMADARAARRGPATTGSRDPVRWRAIEPAKAITANDQIEMRTRRAINITSETARRARKLLFATALWERDQTNAAGRQEPTDWIATSFSDAVSARKITTSHGTFGYLRLWTFDVEHTPLSSTRSPTSSARCPAKD